MDAERSRRIEESKDETSDVNTQRRETYNRLVMVQEDLLKTIQRMKVGGRERWRERGVEGERGGGREGWRERGREGESLAWSKIMEISERLRTMRPRADLTVNLRAFKDYETSS